MRMNKVYRQSGRRGGWRSRAAPSFPRRLAPVLALVAALTGCADLIGPIDRDVVWSVTQFGGTTGTPYVDEEIVVAGVAFSDRFFAVDRKSGALLWDVRLPLPPNAFGGREVSPSTEILRFGDYLIVAANWLHALHRDTGRVVWSLTPPDDWPGRWATLVGDRLIGTGRLVYSIDPGTGEVFWQKDLGELPAAAVYEDGVLYFGARRPLESNVAPAPLGEGHAMAMDVETGTVLWQHPILDHPSAPWRGGVVGRGALTGDLFVLAAQNAQVYALERTTGELRWIHEGERPYSSGTVSLGSVIVVGSSSGDLEGLDAETGELRWVAPLGSSNRKLVQAGDWVLAANGRIWAFDQDGQERWGFGGAGWGRPTFQNVPVPWGDVLYANSVREGLFAVRFPR